MQERKKEIGTPLHARGSKATWDYGTGIQVLRALAMRTASGQRSESARAAVQNGNIPMLYNLSKHQLRGALCPILR
ncbi:hypothetical protein TWF102_002467 [Orbilia oligospora]|uniref:Uncharacterized protein n=1 Tax=Orbilia oligospora TaxID=2813651 RepID=A0A7C8MVI7_ORBOL|nr:hypothetical protein TWF102_002467 [Orbilia oligospora]